MMVVVFSLIYHSQQLNIIMKKLFGTPTGLTFEHIAAMYDVILYNSNRSIEHL